MMHTTAYSSLEYRQDLGIIFFRWLRPLDTEEFKAGYLEVLEAGLAENCHHWLFDTRRRGSASAEAEDWYFKTYIPKLAGLLHRPLYIAVLHSPAHFIHIRDVLGFDTFKEHTRNTLLIMEFFDSEHNAVEWLRQMQEA